MNYTGNWKPETGAYFHLKFNNVIICFIELNLPEYSLNVKTKLYLTMYQLAKFISHKTIK